MREAKTAVAEPGALDQVRLMANRQLNPGRKAELGQFLTPENVAKFMAGLFSDRAGSIRLLDAGAGVGSLTAAFLNRWGSDDVCASAYEVDGTLACYLRETLRAYVNGGFEATVIDRDFIQDAVYKITMGRKGAGFTHAILNPPYKKISSGSQHRALLRAVRLETGLVPKIETTD
jgi:adenine-specific DNA-methyltransferase